MKRDYVTFVIEKLSCSFSTNYSCYFSDEKFFEATQKK